MKQVGITQGSRPMGTAKVLTRGYVHEVVITCGADVVARQLCRIERRPHGSI